MLFSHSHTLCKHTSVLGDTVLNKISPHSFDFSWRFNALSRQHAGKCMTANIKQQENQRKGIALTRDSP